jgi:hypothetical protein
MRLAGITPPRSAGIAVLLACALGLPTFAGTAGAAARRAHVRVKQHSSPTCPGARLPQVTVSPLPGTPEASPQTQISFLGVEAAKLRSIHVIGSLSGVHAGRIRSYASEAGASFLPNAPFQEGEHVSVCATVLTGGGKRRVSTSFQVATEAHLRYQTPFEVAGTRGEAQAYHSVDLKPPLITISHQAGVQSAPGDIFATPYAGPAEHGAMIFESSGQLIWFHRPPNPNWGAADLQLQSFGGHEDLIWWQGLINTFGFGTGEDVIANSAYEPVARIKGANGLQADLHDVQLTPSGAAYITAYYPVRTAVPAPGGGGVLRTAVVLDSVVQEIDIRTGLAMWEWQSLGHVPFAESRLGAPKNAGAPYDYFHVDSLQPLSSGSLMICARNVWGVYAIARHTGQIAWRLGTRRSSLQMGSSARFGWPEEAQMLPGGQLALYDGGAKSTSSPRGEVLDLEWSKKTASLATGGQLQRSVGSPRGAGQGNLAPLPGGNWLVGFGGLPNFTEFNSEGNVIYDAQFPASEVGYRMFREPWQGQPSAPPNLVANTSGSGTTTYVSWNGATDVASWRLYGGSSAQTLEPLATVPASGFETTISSPAAGEVLAQALNAAGEVIGESKVIAAGRT